MEEKEKIAPFTDFYRNIVFADKSFDINYKEVAKVLFNEVDRLTKILDILEEELEVVGELEDESFNWYQRLVELRKQSVDEMEKEITRE